MNKTEKNANEGGIAFFTPPAPSSGMLCPCCGIALRVTDQEGIEIDFCPQCRGIWLDRGELDKLISQCVSYRRVESRLQAGPSLSEAESHAPELPVTETYASARRKSYLRDLFDMDSRD